MGNRFQREATERRMEYRRSMSIAKISLLVALGGMGLEAFVFQPGTPEFIGVGGLTMAAILSSVFFGLSGLYTNSQREGSALARRVFPSWVRNAGK